MQTLERLDHLFCKYVFKGPNPFASKHVKQTPHVADLMWASNKYLIIFKVGEASLECHLVPMTFYLSYYRAGLST